MSGKIGGGAVYGGSALPSIAGIGDSNVNGDINVTPMIDVMLVLLIIFMVITPFLQQGVSVALPRDMNNPDEDPAIIKESSVVVAITEGGKLYLGKKEIDKDTLAATLKPQVRAGKSGIVEAEGARCFLELHLPPPRMVINGAVRGGADIKIEHQVTIGAEKRQSPEIGDGVFIGAGAKIIGPVKIGAGARVGANSVVLHDVEAHTTVVGIPAKPTTRKRDDVTT